MINEDRIARDVAVLGASAGGVEVLIEVIAGLPADFPGTVAVVLHRSPMFGGRLPHVFGRRARIPVSEPEDGEPVARGRVYLAPRDRHLRFDDGHFRLDRGPKQHFTRPAVDPLFHSAAVLYGPRVVGVLLTGNGGDGVSGLISIKQARGLSLVQDPAEATYQSMPRSALLYDDVDGLVTVPELPAILARLCAGEAVDIPPQPRPPLAQAPGRM